MCVSRYCVTRRDVDWVKRRENKTTDRRVTHYASHPATKPGGNEPSRQELTTAYAEANTFALNPHSIRRVSTTSPLNAFPSASSRTP